MISAKSSHLKISFSLHYNLDPKGKPLKTLHQVSRWGASKTQSKLSGNYYLPFLSNDTRSFAHNRRLLRCTEQSASTQ